MHNKAGCNCCTLAQSLLFVTVGISYKKEVQLILPFKNVVSGSAITYFTYEMSICFAVLTSMQLEFHPRAQRERLGNKKIKNK